MKGINVFLILIIICGTNLAQSRFEQKIESFAENVKSIIEKNDNDELKELIVHADSKEEKEAVEFLISYMPQRDLDSLSSDYILENIKYALKVKKHKWNKEISNKIFLNDVLPYASLNEKRDSWRKMFYNKFYKLVQNETSISKAAIKLNRNIYDSLNVRYHAKKRPKPDQCPSESIEASFASCTGLSILLVDACRACGIPARIAGTPKWTTVDGNHTWVEIWDGQWYFLEAADKRSELNSAWFNDRASKADKTKEITKIYASSFKETEYHFPLVWDLNIKYVNAVDVTDRYLKLKSEK